jgi:hypothetical protein
MRSYWESSARRQHPCRSEPRHCGLPRQNWHNNISPPEMRMIGLRIIAGTPRGYGTLVPSTCGSQGAQPGSSCVLPVLQRSAAVDGHAVRAAQVAGHEVDARNGLWIGRRQESWKRIPFPAMICMVPDPTWHGASHPSFRVRPDALAGPSHGYARSALTAGNAPRQRWPRCLPPRPPARCGHGSPAR